MIILFLMTGQNDSIAVGIPGSHGGGHIFFDGDFDFEGQVKAEVGNAEAADAEDFADQVATVYNCAQGEDDSWDEWGSDQSWAGSGNGRSDCMRKQLAC